MRTFCLERVAGAMLSQAAVQHGVYDFVIGKYKYGTSRMMVGRKKYGGTIAVVRAEVAGLHERSSVGRPGYTINASDRHIVPNVTVLNNSTLINILSL